MLDLFIWLFILIGAVLTRHSGVVGLAWFGAGIFALAGRAVAVRRGHRA